MFKKKLVQCATKVGKSAVKRTSIDGVEHVIISSYTLPDNVVMNGGLYPADEITRGFSTLERTLAPVEHPTDSQGNFISANDPIAIHNFHAGAFNVNVTQENGRIHIEKFINVQEAMKTDRGKRLMDRINEFETNEKPRPIHTSVGVWLEVEELETPKTNAAGDEYTWIAHNMVFDHDAILLDSVGAAQPSQGVGIAVNRKGDEVEVERVFVDNDEVLDQPDNIERLSHEEIRDLLQTALNRPPLSADLVQKVFDDTVIFELKEELFSVPYVIDNGQVTIIGIPVPMNKDVVYTPKTNTDEGDAMRELILQALAAAGITVNADISDADLMVKYNEMQTKQNESDDGQPAGDDLVTVVANAIKPLSEEIAGLKTKLNAVDAAEVDRLVGIVTNSGKYPELDDVAAKTLPVETLKKMAGNCGTAHGIPFFNNTLNQAPKFGGPDDMPE